MSFSHKHIKKRTAATRSFLCRNSLLIHTLMPIRCLLDHTQGMRAERSSVRLCIISALPPLAGNSRIRVKMANSTTTTTTIFLIIVSQPRRGYARRGYARRGYAQRGYAQREYTWHASSSREASAKSRCSRFRNRPIFEKPSWFANNSIGRSDSFQVLERVDGISVKVEPEMEVRPRAVARAAR
jgi:hypothetical protein